MFVFQRQDFILMSPVTSVLAGFWLQGGSQRAGHRL